MIYALPIRYHTINTYLFLDIIGLIEKISDIKTDFLYSEWEQKERIREITLRNQSTKSGVTIAIQESLVTF